MTRMSGLFVLIISTFAVAAEPPIKPTIISLNGENQSAGEKIDSLAKQIGISIDRTSIPTTEQLKITAGQSFWITIQKMAEQSRHHLIVAGKGDRLAFVKNDEFGRPQPSISGPFRFAVKQFTGKTDFDSGRTSHEIQIEFHWEPRMPVFRVTGMTATVSCDQSEQPTLTSDQPKANVSGFRHPLTFRMTGFQRTTQQLKSMKGEVTVTAAEKMLRFSFNDLTSQKPSKTIDKVTTSLLKWEKIDDLWEARVEIIYPEGMPQFESFEAESWLRDNVCRLISPDRTKSLESNDFQVRVTAKGAVIDYRFKEDVAKGISPGKGWCLEVETPSPLMEFSVPFEFKNIKLP